MADISHLARIRGAIADIENAIAAINASFKAVNREPYDARDAINESLEACQRRLTTWHDTHIKGDELPMWRQGR